MNDPVLSGFCRSVEDAQELVNIVAAVQQHAGAVPDEVVWELLTSEGLATRDRNCVKLASMVAQIIFEKALKSGVCYKEGNLDEEGLRESLSRHVPGFDL
ncbi:MAG: uncharacterized protein KVP18_005131 [Porospora cf. gigantea A]|uniref:uncharacterized protein n=1 Tax=Porospora cf. gigantea A TaxID=2853593 RepID=UPI00355ACB38|nr:MAG: hypothetical protein KVP18_005131 [Porospora cf. gigantea A]